VHTVTSYPFLGVLWTMFMFSAWLFSFRTQVQLDAIKNEMPVARRSPR
jgi:hypothetical protein